MRKKLIPFLLLTALFFISCENSPKPPQHRSESEQIKPAGNPDTTTVKKEEVFYQCPMHPEVTSDKPGTCPKCGMDLEKKTR
jgi:hypothetical protein